VLALMTREDVRKRAEIAMAARPEFVHLVKEAITAQKDQTTADIPLMPATRYQELRALMVQNFGEVNVSVGERDRKQHGKTMSGGHLAVPDMIVYPHTLDQVQWLAAFATTNHIPLIPYGHGTSFEKNCATLGIVLNSSRMSKIIQFHSEDREIRVQAGASQQEINEYLRDSGCYFPMDTECDASIGGMIATNAVSSGRWRIGDLVKDVCVVLADGSLIRTHASRAELSSTGPDLTSLFVGSEGAFGIVVEATLALLPVPKAITMGVCTFATLSDALEASTAINSLQHYLNRCQLVSPSVISALNSLHQTDFEVKPTLFMEAHGVSRETSDLIIEACKDLCRERGMLGFVQYADNELEAVPMIWMARSTLWLGLLRQSVEEHSELMLLDVAVPASRFKEAVLYCTEEEKRLGLSSFTICNNLLGSIVFATKIQMHECERLQRFQQLKDILSKKIAASFEGSCGGTFGLGKQPDLMRMELGSTLIQKLCSLKRDLYPYEPRY